MISDEDIDILKPLSYAYRDMSKHDFEKILHKLENFEREEDR